MLVGAGLLLAVLVTYYASLANAPVWDDRPLVVDNPYLSSAAGLGRLVSTDLWTASARVEPSSYYRPFTMFTFWVNVMLGGRSASWLRLGNALIHAANALLLAVFARRAFGLAWRVSGVFALLFAVAPVCSEPVLWISGRFDLLVVTFALLALLATRIEGRLGLALSVASVAAGLLCKESFIGWLPLLVVDDVLFLPRRSVRRRAYKFVAIAAVTASYLLLRKLVGIPSLDVVRNTGVRALVESYVFLIGTFLRELVWPATLDPFRPYTPLSGSSLLLALAALLLLVGVGAALLWRHRASRVARVAAFGLVWFLLGTLPSAVVGPTLAMVGDRYAYLPLVGIFLAAMALVTALEERHARAWIVASALGGALAVAGALVTRTHARDWRDDTTLAFSSLAADPENPYALYWLGSDAAQRGRLDEADALLGRALARNRESWRIWNAVCYLRLNQNRLAEAERACGHASRLFDANPRIWVNLASVYVREQRWSDALPSAERALVLRPGYVEAHYLAGVSSANLGLYAAAEAHARAGLAEEPSHARLLALQAELDRLKRAP